MIDDPQQKPLEEPNKMIRILAVKNKDGGDEHIKGVRNELEDLMNSGYFIENTLSFPNTQEAELTFLVLRKQGKLNHG